MKITKIGHCCLLIETKGIRILTDPGSFTVAQNEIKNIDLIIITHEHADHLHVDSLEIIRKNNPKVEIITNNSVGKILKEKNIPFKLLTNGNESKIKNIQFTAIGEQHAEIYKSITPVENTGYFIDNSFFYPGDAFTKPNKQIQLLALPLEGPWMKLSEAIEYALAVKPIECIPVHDGRLRTDRIGATYKITNNVLTDNNIKFTSMDEMKEYIFKY